jgi:hypothetical protein
MTIIGIGGSNLILSDGICTSGPNNNNARATEMDYIMNDCLLVSTDFVVSTDY